MKNTQQQAPEGENRAKRSRATPLPAARSLSAPSAAPILITLLVTLAVCIVLGAVTSPPALLSVGTATALVLALLWVRHSERGRRRRDGTSRTRASAALVPLPSPRLRFVSVFLAFIFAWSLVRATGSPDTSASPWTGLLFLPVMLGALFWGVTGGIWAGVSAAALLLLRPSAQTSLTAAWIEALVTVGVGTLGGALAGSLRSAATEAHALARAERSRATEESVRATETEWFMDTSVMMDSLYDLENMLSVALIRLPDLVPCDVAAVFLRDTSGEGDGHLNLVQMMGAKPDVTPPVRQLPLAEQEDIWRGEFAPRRWHDVRQYTDGLGTLAAFNPEARGVLVAPLRTLNDFFGLLYLSVPTPGGISEETAALVQRFAQQMVYPIQRVRLQAIATTDVMTGLSNHRAFRSRLHDEVERAHRYGRPLSLVLLDIDHFKRVNDTHGHRAGDALLAQVAAILRRSVRNGVDLAARYGGEEMALICPETSTEHAHALAERIRVAVEGTLFRVPESAEPVRMTVSLGVATMPDHAIDLNALIEATDRALYAAKNTGRNAAMRAESGNGGLLAPRA